MTNPNNAIGTNAAYNGRTSVNAFNDSLNAYTRGIMSGWACVPNVGLTVSVGGVSGTRDVAIAEDNLGNKTTINNISAQPINVTLPTAPVSNSRIDLIVIYVDGSPQGVATVTDNPSACGIVSVKGTASATPSVPNDSAIRAAITADGAAGTTAYYTIVAQITMATGTTDITSAMIASGVRTEVPLISEVLSEPTSVAYVDTANIIDNAVTAVKTNFGGNYSTSEQNTGFTWIDGSAIYKKTINFGALPNATNKTMALGISNIAMIISLSGVAVGSGSYCRPLPYAASTGLAQNIALYTESDNTLTIVTGSDRSSLTGYITLYYTKTS